MAAAENQAEIVTWVAGHQYGEVNVYGGTALLGDGVVTVKQDAIDEDEQRRKALINDLDFDGSGARRDQLKLTEIGTSSFDWVESTRLSIWLRDGSTAFWISGKPGSGKSTLMRYLVDSRKTQDLLETNGEKWRILHFFYDFRLGGSAGNRPEGMLRTFLVQLLRSFPELAKHIDDRRIYQELRQGSVDAFIDILATAVRSIDIRICTFIDGLDEYDGQLWELCSHLEILRDRTGIKMCLASRPEPKLVNAFSGFPTIAMQDHNGASIQAYITRKVLQKSVSHPSIGAAFSNRLSRLLRDKAQGVILWVKLVVNEILDVYDNSTTEQHLFELLHVMPGELGDLYDRLLAKLPDAYRSNGILVLYLVANYRGVLGEEQLLEKILFQAICFIYEIQSSHPFFGQRATCENVEVHVKHALGQLLDFIEHEDMWRKSYRSARLIHETLATHLRRSVYSSDLQSTCAACYRGLNSWTQLALDVIHRTSSDLKPGLAELSSKMQSLLEDRLDLDACEEVIDRKYLEDWPLPLSSIFSQHVETSGWTDISELLHFCFAGLDKLLNHAPEVVTEFFQLPHAVLCSDAITLLLFCNHHEYLLKRLAVTRVIAAKLLRLWRVGRLDLAFSAALSILPYLNEMFHRSAMEESMARDTFDILLSCSIWNDFDDQTEDLKRLLNCDAMRDFQMDGGYVCALNDNVDRSFSNDELNISIRQFSRPNQIWSQEHDRDCRYYGSAHTLITHWCRTVFRDDTNSDTVFKLLTKANVDVNAKCNKDITPIEMIFDMALLRWKFYYSRCLHRDASESLSLLCKVETLLHHGCGLPSVEQLEGAVKRAERLRRYFILHCDVSDKIWVIVTLLFDSIWARTHRRLDFRKQEWVLRDDASGIQRLMRHTIQILKDAKTSNMAR